MAPVEAARPTSCAAFRAHSGYRRAHFAGARIGILTKVGAWIEGQIRTLGMFGGALKAALGKFLIP
jgi:hypothetical protein